MKSRPEGYGFLAALLLAVPALAAAQAPALPGWLVPVVQLISDTEVVPTTGIALGGDRVLVPVEFTATEYPLVILDGGGDLVRHGRPATVEARMNLAGIAVLSAAGLSRTGPELAEGPPADGAVTALLAFPTPEGIRQGLRSLRREARVSVDAQGRRLVDPATPLPNLTGALVNGCGQWQGVSAARGAASLTTSRNTLYQWLPELKQTLERAGITLPVGRCDQVLAMSTPVLAAPEPMPPEPMPLEPAPERPPEVQEPEVQEPEVQEQAGEREDAPPETEPEATPAQPPPTEPASGPEPDAADPRIEPELQSDLEQDPGAGLATENEADASGVPAQEAEGDRQQDPVAGPVPASGTDDPPANLPVDGPDPDPGPDPDTRPWAWGLLLLLPALFFLARWRRRSRVPLQEHAASAVTPAPSWLLVGSDRELDLVAGSAGLDLVLGRFDADVLLLDPSVSRRHGRLHEAAGSLQYTDLDAMNGSWINDVACIPGNPYPLAEGDQLRLGEVTLILQRPDPSGAER